MAFPSVYEMFTPLTTVRKQHFWDYFSGATLNSRWTQTNSGGAGTYTMADEVDGGLLITTPTSINTQQNMDFGDKRNFSPTGSVFIAVVKSSWTNVYNDFGFTNTQPNAQSAIFRWTSHNSDGKIHLLTCGSGITEDVATSVSGNATDWSNIKIECKSSSVEGSINGVLERTHSTQIPTNDTKLQPYVGIYNTVGSAKTCQIRYMECYNT